LARGSKTPAGLARSAQNALRHGLLARCVVLPDESAESFADLLRQYLDRFQPADDIELALVEELASSFWRVRRAWAVETRALADAAAAYPTYDPLGRITAAFSDLAARPTLPL